jgi:hypothetical protein
MKCLNSSYCWNLLVVRVHFSRISGGHLTRQHIAGAGQVVTEKIQKTLPNPVTVNPDVGNSGPKHEK